MEANLILCDGAWLPLHQYFGSTTLHGFVSLIDNVETKLYDTSIWLTRWLFSGDMNFHENGISGTNRLGEFPCDIEQRQRSTIQKTRARCEAERHPDKHGPMRHAPAEVAVRGKDIISVQRIEVGCQPGELNDICIQNGTARGVKPSTNF
jgi:hypothetical protein